MADKSGESADISQGARFAQEHSIAWTDSERLEINAYAAALRENINRGGLIQETLQGRARREHCSDAEIIASWEAIGMTGEGPRICSEIRRRMAARVEAFNAIGEVL